MMDIKFYQNVYNIKKLLREGKITPEDAFNNFTTARRKEPVVYSIETTNNCNMKCKMCPRPILMTRPVGIMSMLLFEKIVKQIKPYLTKEWVQWKAFVKKNYNIKESEMSEKHFFYYILPKVIVLHNFGEPLLDINIVNRIKILSNYKVLSYFSSHPYNISYNKGRSLFIAGLDYLKLSSENINYFIKKQDVIKELIELSNDFKVQIILNLIGDEKEQIQLLKLFGRYNVYIYNKSLEGHNWYTNEETEMKNIHWLEPCQFPWSSLSIQWDGSIVPCCQDFNSEMLLGNSNINLLYDIWNSVNYYYFRKNHLTKQEKNKCICKCDMKVLGDY